MDRFLFLSDEWLSAAREIRAEYHGRAPQVATRIRMNQIIQEVPFGTGTVHAHVDTSSGELEVDTGLLEDPDVTITVAYDTAKAILVDGDSQAAMQAFLTGRIKVDGDVTKMIALQAVLAGGTGDPAALELTQRLHDITV